MKEQNQRRCWIFVLSMVLVTFASAIYLSTAMFKAPSPPSLSCVNNAFGVDHEASNATGGLLIVYCQRDRPSVACDDYRSDTHYCNGTLRSLWSQASIAGEGYVGGFIYSQNGTTAPDKIDEYCNTVESGYYLVDLGGSEGVVKRRCNDTLTGAENEEQIMLEITGSALFDIVESEEPESRRRSTNDIGDVEATLYYRHNSGAVGDAVVTSGATMWTKQTQPVTFLPGNRFNVTFSVNHKTTTDVGIRIIAYAVDGTTELYTASWGMVTSNRLNSANLPAVHVMLLPTAEATNEKFFFGFVQSYTITRLSDAGTLGRHEMHEGDVFTLETEISRVDVQDVTELVDENILFNVVENGGLLTSSGVTASVGTLTADFESTGKIHCEAPAASSGTPPLWSCKISSNITAGSCSAGTCTQEIRYLFYAMMNATTPETPLRITNVESILIDVLSATNDLGVVAVFEDRPSIGARPTLDAGSSTLTGFISVASSSNGLSAAYDLVVADDSAYEMDLTVTVTSHVEYDLSDTVSSGHCQLASATLTRLGGVAPTSAANCITGCDFGTEPGTGETTSGKLLVTFEQNYVSTATVICYLKISVEDSGQSSPVVIAAQSSNTRVIVRIVNDAPAVSYFDISAPYAPTLCALAYSGSTCIILANALEVEGWNDPVLDFEAKSDPVVCSLSPSLTANDAFTIDAVSAVGGTKPYNNNTENVACRVTRNSVAELEDVSGDIFYTVNVDSTFVTGLSGSPPPFSKVVSLPFTAQNGFKYYDFIDGVDKLPAYTDTYVESDLVQLLYATPLAQGQNISGVIVDKMGSEMTLDTDYKLDGDGKPTLFSADAMGTFELCPDTHGPTGTVYGVIPYLVGVETMNAELIEWPTVREVWIESAKEVDARYVGLLDGDGAVTKAWQVGNSEVQEFGASDFFHLVCGRICTWGLCSVNT